jgi:ATP diphosphatase
LRREVDRIPLPGPRPAGRDGTPATGAAVDEELHLRLQDEVGDLLFTVVNLARYLAVDPELALRRSNRKFRRRFAHLEQSLREKGTELTQASLEQMEAHWQRSKQSERE